MQLWALLALAAACPPCGCSSLLAQHGRLARRSGQAPAGGALGDPVDPLATEAAAAVSPAAVAAKPPGQVDLEMATTNPQLVALALANVSDFEAEVAKRLALVLQVPAARFTVTPQSMLPGAAPAAPAAPAGPPAPAAFLQTRAETQVGNGVVTWVLHIVPVAVPPTPNATNLSNVTVLVCPPCPCPTDPTPAPLVLPANSTAPMPVPRDPSAEALGAELMLMLRTPSSAFQGVMPQTTARVPGGSFPAPEPTSVALGSRVRGPTPADEAYEINDGTQKMVEALKFQLKAANQERAAILTGSSMKPPEFNGKLPLPSEDTDPWSSMKDDSALGRSAS